MKIVVMSLGGSLIAPDKIDTAYLARFSKFISSLVKKDYKFVIVTGGGRISRDYMDSLRKIRCSENEVSFAGIKVTRLNAFIASKYLKTKAKVPENIGEIKSLIRNNKVVVCGGFKPGMTSDGDAAEIAKMLKTKILFNLTNVEGLFDKDPRKFSNAKLIRKISSSDFLKIMMKIGHKAGQHFVLDLNAAEICFRNKIKVFILNGKSLNNFAGCMRGKPFKGTEIY
jgi:uridylate kinase